MESWAVLCEALASTFNVVASDDDRVVIEHAAGPTVITVEVTVVEPEVEDAEPWLAVTAPVCVAEAWSAREALEMNARFAVGSLSLLDELYVLRHFIGLGSVELGAVQRTVLMLARRAAAISRSLGERAASARAMFENYAV